MAFRRTATASLTSLGLMPAGWGTDRMISITICIAGFRPGSGRGSTWGCAGAAGAGVLLITCSSSSNLLIGQASVRANSPNMARAFAPYHAAASSAFVMRLLR